MWTKVNHQTGLRCSWALLNSGSLLTICLTVSQRDSPTSAYIKHRQHNHETTGSHYIQCIISSYNNRNWMPLPLINSALYEIVEHKLSNLLTHLIDNIQHLLDQVKWMKKQNGKVFNADVCMFRNTCTKYSPCRTEHEWHRLQWLVSSPSSAWSAPAT